MKPAPFEYVAPTTIEDACEQLAGHGSEARLLAGGQSLIPMLALRLTRPALLIDLNRIVSLSHIRQQGGDLCIGAMTRQRAVLESALVAQHAPLLQQVLRDVGHPPTRARGTVGGSLAHADPAAELPVAALALQSKFVIRSSKEERIVDAENFFRGMFETAIQPSEMLVEIRIPSSPAAGSGFEEVALRKGDFAIVSVAAWLVVGNDNVCTSARVVLGSVGPKPVRCLEVEANLTGRAVNAAVVTTAANAIPEHLIESDSLNASRAYRQRIAPALTRRALTAAWQVARKAAQ